MNKKIIDLTGRKFGRIIVVSFSHRDTRTRWNCLCDCGATLLAESSALKSGNTKSCGCLHKEMIGTLFKTHGDKASKRKPKEHNTWTHIKQRCYNHRNIHYKNYGGRGITVCRRWLLSYSNFLHDMGRAPTPKHTIERINNNGNYTPKNCKWATYTEQANNRTNSFSINHKGENKNLVQWCNEFGIPYSRTRDRIVKLGWTIDKAFYTKKLRV